MKHPSDAVAQMTFMGEDDRAFQRERAQAKRPKDQTPEIPDGPCCHRCSHWARPGSLDQFGTCGVLGYVAEKGQSLFDRGYIGVPEELVQSNVADWRPLPTRPWFAGCSLFWPGGQ